MRRRLPDLLGTLLSLGLIAFATLVPTRGYPRTGFLCLGCGNLGAPDVVVNVFLFVPLGIVLARWGWRPLVALGAGLALSAAIELAQVYIPGRAPTLRDILMNGLGAGLGALLVRRLADWLTPGLRSRVMLWLALAGVLLAAGLTGFFMRFEPPGGVYYGQWVPDQPHLERYRGRLLSAEVNGLPIVDTRTRYTDSLRISLAERVQLRVVGTAGPPTRRHSAIFSMMNDEQDEILLIGPLGRDLVVRVRRVAATWRLDQPEFRFHDALAGLEPGAPFTITFDGTRLGGCATVNGVEHCTGRPRAGSTWRLARSFGGAPPIVRRALDAITVVVLVLPFGLLVRSVPRREAIAAGLVLVVGFPAVAWWSGLALPTAWEWLGVAVAIALGMALHARVRPDVPATTRAP